MDRNNQANQQGGGKTVSGLDAARANEYFDHFLNASTLKHILGYYRGLMDHLHLKPNVFTNFYPKLRANLTSWRAKALWKKFDSRASHKCYGKGKLAAGTRVLIIGGGPCGMRTAIEAQLLGAKVVVIEKRDRFSRNNVLHLWPFVIEDLRILGAKKFFGRFCAGAIDHISIRQLQCILLKVALLLGVEVHTEVGFEKLVEPNASEKTGWRAEVKPSNHPVSLYEFDVIIGADGKRNTLQGFSRKEFRGKLAIAITANFINKKSEAEARVEEISGVAFIFNQKFFKDLLAETRIDLENIVYYKDDTHYFVMTAKKASLIEKGVIKQDLADTEKLLSPDNVDREALQQYAIEAANFSTNYQMPNLEFAVNHYGQPDIAMFDFTSMYAAENASKVVERNGHRLLMILVGDSLLEPFWPTGSGCARGFLSSLDAAWAIRSWSMGSSPLDVMAERESIYRLLAQTTPDNLNKDWKSYTLDPATRYPNLNKNVVLAHQVICLYETDNPASIDRLKRISNEKPNEVPKKKRRGNVDTEVLLNWLTEQLKEDDTITITDISSVFKDGKVLCAIIHRYRPDLLDYNAIKNDEPAKNNQLAIDLLEKELGIPPVMTGADITNTEDYLTLVSYVTEVYDAFRGEIPYIKQPKLKLPSKIPKSLFPTKLKSSPALPKNETVPCKKCYDAYICETKTRPPQSFDAKICEKLVGEVTKPEKTLKNSKSSFLSAKKNSVCIKTGMVGSVGTEAKPKLRKFVRKVKQKPKEQLKHEFPSPLPGNGDSTIDKPIAPDRDDLEKKCLQKIVTERNEKLKKFMSKLLSKRKKSKLKKCSLSVIPETKTDIALSKDKCDCSQAAVPPKIITSRIGMDPEGFEPSPQTFVHQVKSAMQSDIVSRKLLVESDEESLIRIRVIEKKTRNKFTMRKIEYYSNQLTVSSKVGLTSKGFGNHDKELLSALADLGGRVRRHTSNCGCQSQFQCRKFSSKQRDTMHNEGDCIHNQIYSRVSNWISSNDFLSQDNSKADTDIETVVSNGKITDITSVSKMDSYQYDEVRVEERTDVVNFADFGGSVPVVASSEEKLAEKIRNLGNKSVRTLSKFSQYSPFQYGPGNLKSSSAPPTQFSVIVEGEETELPESTKISELSFKTIRTTSIQPMLPNQPSRPSSRHKRHHADVLAQKTVSAERKARKRRTLEKVGASVDHENKTSNQTFRGGGRDEDLAARIKSLENKWRDPEPIDKKPKDLLRAIGKIETSDWNIKEIEKKIMENKLGKPTKVFDKEKVPKWSKEQFLARQTKIEKQHLDRQDSVEAKYADIDKNIKSLDQKLKEGTVRQLGQNKVATITEKLTSKIPPEPKQVEKTAPRTVPVLPTQGSEMCHFCGKRVYLMERLSAEGRFFHHSCFKCQYCFTQLRLGSYAFDKDGLYGYKFFCLQHFGMIGVAPIVKITRKPSQKLSAEQRRSPEKKLSGIAGVDLLDKVHSTPERIEFSNLSAGHVSSDQEDSLSQMDEDEWTDKNFGASCAEIDSDDDSSSMSDTDGDDEDAFDDALEEPVTKEGTMKWAERWKNSYSRKRHNSDEYSSSDRSSYYENSSDEDESDTATEGEDEIRARELRKQEVCVVPPIVHTDTGTDTEIVSDESSSDSSSEIHNSATEISTDSEFAQDEPTPTREIPSILLNDFHVTKTRGSGRQSAPKKLQVTTGYLQRPANGTARRPNQIELKLKPLVAPTPTRQAAPTLLARTEGGYALNRTQSTGGIAAKVSLELKKRYLLGEQVPGNIQKSGSASTLETKFKTFHTNISDCQKMLKPAAEISASMQTFCDILNEKKSPVLSPQSSHKQLIDIAPPAAEAAPEPFVNESLGRPRSPVHETSIIVPQIDWNKSVLSISSDSLASSGNEVVETPIPRVEIHTVNDEDKQEDELVLDSLSPQPATKSIGGEKKSLNQPKPLPNLENLLPAIHNSLHNKWKKLDTELEAKLECGGVETLPAGNSSGISSPESATAAALTETELSDWARDEAAVSDGFEDEDFAKNKTKAKKSVISEPIITEAMNSILSGNLDNIEFMDTGSESSSSSSSSEDGIADSQHGYVLFTDDSLCPNINDIVEAVNTLANEKTDNSQCTNHLLKVREDQKPFELDDDSLLMVETGTTTEENTCSDSTVKNVTEICAEKPRILAAGPSNSPNEKEATKVSVQEEVPLGFERNVDFQEHCHRLQSRVEFGNVKDSIDVRKSRRKSKPDLIQDEAVSPQPIVPEGVTLTPTPDILYNKDVLKKERDTNQRLIQEMVMNKMKAENKSLERKKRKSQLSPFGLTKSATTDLVSQINSDNLNKSSGSGACNAPDVLLSTNYPLQISKTVNVVGVDSYTPMRDQYVKELKSVEKREEESVQATPIAPPRQHRLTTDSGKSLDKSKPSVRLRNKENENVDVEKESLVVEKRSSWLYSNNTPKKNLFRRCQSGSYETSTPLLKNQSEASSVLSSRTKSIPDFPQKITLIGNEGCESERGKIFKSDPNICESSSDKAKKKSKDGERRKSFGKMLTTLFTKKSPSLGGSKGLFSKLSPKSKDISKSCSMLDSKEDSVIEPIRRKSSSEGFINRHLVTPPPPVPPLPVNYVARKTDDSSEGEQASGKKDYSSCDTLDHTGMMEQSTSSLAGRRSSRSAKRSSKQAQHKRHRMAQEIQRKLEETEVKTKELERRGVLVEKALRGEDDVVGSCGKDEADLLQEWFDLMRDRTELRRYERELIVRGEELELEDRHARLQHELRERLEIEKQKTEDDIKLEESIIEEMMKIVEKRDSLIAEIEEDRIRYSNEDRDLEEQMLAKGLRLTPIKKTPEK